MPVTAGPLGNAEFRARYRDGDSAVGGAARPTVNGTFRWGSDE